MLPCSIAFLSFDFCAFSDFSHFFELRDNCFDVNFSWKSWFCNCVSPDWKNDANMLSICGYCSEGGCVYTVCVCASGSTKAGATGEANNKRRALRSLAYFQKEPFCCLSSCRFALGKKHTHKVRSARLAVAAEGS
jgi:hypothetical protein